MELKPPALLFRASISTPAGFEEFAVATSDGAARTLLKERVSMWVWFNASAIRVHTYRM
jgi:hypothetical protein